MRKAISTYLILLVLPLALLAESVNSFIYDFENLPGSNDWTLNAGSMGDECTNKWYIGQAANNGGEWGMYISYDNGESAGYVSGDGKAQVVSAYIPVTLNAGAYELSFDWQAMGMPEDGLYVCWVPEGVHTNSSSESNFIPKYVSDYAVRVDGREKLNDSRWNSIFGPMVSDGTPHKLVFVWANGTTGVENPGACIDNINIIPLSSCSRPTDIEITYHNNSATISWKGDATSYDIRIKSQVTGEWKEISQRESNTLSLYDFPSGAIDVYIRSNCEEFNSVWVSKTVLLYYPNDECIDYINIHDGNCYSGTRDAVMKNKGKIDMGYKSKSSRHTVHYDILETDKVTEGRLKTVHPGSNASVRLGNSLTGNTSETIIYDLKVSDSPEDQILYMNYALVQQQSGHTNRDRPMFTIEILDSRGNKLEDKCIDSDLTLGYSEGVNAGWETIGKGDDAITWRNWSTVGFNISKYKGQDVKIKVSSYDCGDGHHFGYGYFSFDCGYGIIDKKGCGEDDITFYAPKGFEYRWYKKGKEGNILSTEEYFTVDAGIRDTFNVDLISLNNSSCYNTLTALSIPRYPIANGGMKTSVTNCETVVEFSNESYVAYKNADGSFSRSEDHYDSIRWYFGDGTSSNLNNPIVIYPESGGKFKAQLIVYLSHCDSVIEWDLDIPSSRISRDTLAAVICSGDSYEYNGTNYFMSVEISDTATSTLTGCDSISTFILDVVDLKDSTVFDTVCYNQLPYNFYGKDVYDNNEKHTHLIQASKGCDSLQLTLDLMIYESMDVEIVSIGDNCNSNVTIDYDIKSGDFNTYDLIFTSSDLSSYNMYDVERDGSRNSIEFSLGNLTPNRYNAKLILNNINCGKTEKDIIIDVPYSKDIVVQRWNDVLGVKNEKHNGGSYVFSAFQWYKDGVAIEGATSANLYIENGLDSAEYYVDLTRASDGFVMRSCPIIPSMGNAAKNISSVTVKESTINVEVENKASVHVWNMYGQKVASSDVESGVINLTVKEGRGVYIVELIFEDGIRETYKTIIGN